MNIMYKTTNYKLCERETVSWNDEDVQYKT